MVVVVVVAVVLVVVVVGPVPVRRVALEVLRQVDDVDRLERALLHADAAADAELLRDPRALRLGRHLDAQLAHLSRPGTCDGGG